MYYDHARAMKHINNDNSTNTESGLINSQLESIPGAVEDPTDPYIYNIKPSIRGANVNMQLFPSPIVSHAPKSQFKLARPTKTEKTTKSIKIQEKISKNPTQLMQTKPPEVLLSSLSSILIKQKAQFMEIVMGCEKENEYRVYMRKPQITKASHHQLTLPQKHERGPLIFRCLEKSRFVSRNFLSGSCRPFEINLEYKIGKSNYQKFLKLVRPFASTLCCTGRPYMNVFILKDDKEILLGKINEPYDCTTIILNVIKGKDHDIYSITADYCTCAVLCQCPTKDCSEVHFVIQDSNTGLPVGQIDKVFISLFL